MFWLRFYFRSANSINSPSAETLRNPFFEMILKHYNDVIMTTVASQITSLTVVCSTVYSDADQRKHPSSASRAFVWGIHRDRWIPHTKGQLRGKCFHLMTSSWHTKEKKSPETVFTGGNWAKLSSSRCHRRGRSLREVFANVPLFGITDISEVCNQKTKGHCTPKT